MLKRLNNESKMASTGSWIFLRSSVRRSVGWEGAALRRDHQGPSMESVCQSEALDNLLLKAEQGTSKYQVASSAACQYVTMPETDVPLAELGPVWLQFQIRIQTKIACKSCQPLAFFLWLSLKKVIRIKTFQIGGLFIIIYLNFWWMNKVQALV